MLSRAGLTFLYAATPWRWRPDRVFDPDAIPDRLRATIETLAPDDLSRLVDALDPTLLDEEYQLYACRNGYVPPLPAWTESRFEDPPAFDDLVPELTGLVSVEANSGWSAAGGRVTYRTVTGMLGELDRMSGLMVAEVDGTAACGEIERRLASKTRAADKLDSRQRWVDLADAGLILLRPPAAG
jgi:hypothetical protein